MEIVKTINLKKYYKMDNYTVKAVDNINLNINNHEFIAIVGSSGSGKSTISKLISKNYEAKIIDADKIAKEMTKNNGEYLQAIRQAFGNDVIKNNELDRKKLADIVFLNRAEKETFEYVVEEIKKELEANQNLDYQYIILDVPLLFESKLDKLCDYTIGVIAPKTEKIKRICKRDKLSKEKALQRLNSQPNDEFFTKNCNTVINNENKEETIKMMNEIMLKLQ